MQLTYKKSGQNQLGDRLTEVFLGDQKIGLITSFSGGIYKAELYNFQGERVKVQNSIRMKSAREMFQAVTDIFTK